VSASRTEEEALQESIRCAVRRALGAEPTRIDLLPGALGLRRFARVWVGGEGPERLIARVDRPEDPAGRPPGILPEPPLEPIRSLLERSGLPVPARYGAGEVAGVELLEDAGDLSLADAAAEASNAERRSLYAEACALVPRLQRIEDPGDVEAFSRRLDPATFAYKADLFCTHSLTAAGTSPTPAAAACVRRAFDAIARIAADAPLRLAHRDLQAQNILVIEGASIGARLRLIDLQGALLAPPEYDLVCLLRDSYVELSAAEIAAHFEETRRQLPDAPEPELAIHRFDCLTLTRKGKDHARFLYAAATRGDRRYLAHVPTTVRHLRAAATRVAARDPAFAELAELIHALPETACEQ
jgi:aminoglycoside/choline kinase family phosphotransferase